mgnify:FL=1
MFWRQPPSNRPAKPEERESSVTIADVTMKDVAVIDAVHVEEDVPAKDVQILNDIIANFKEENRVEWDYEIIRNMISRYMKLQKKGHAIRSNSAS